MLGYDPDSDRHHHRPDPHYRLYLAPRDDKPCVIQVQSFDYRDYDSTRFLSNCAFDTEDEATQALQQLLVDAATVLGVLPNFLKISNG